MHHALHSRTLVQGRATHLPCPRADTEWKIDLRRAGASGGRSVCVGKDEPFDNRIRSAELNQALRLHDRQIVRERVKRVQNQAARLFFDMQTGERRGRQAVR